MNPIPAAFRALDLKHGCVELSHGGGGRAMAQLIEELFLAAFDNDWLRAQDDGARLHRSLRATGDGDRQPCRFPAVLSRRRHRLSVGSRHDQRCGDDRR
jgi:hypothetical protein